MRNMTMKTEQNERRSYVKPAVHNQGDVIRLTKGDPGDREEGHQIFWGDFVPNIELPKRFE